MAPRSPSLPAPKSSTRASFEWSLGTPFVTGARRSELLDRYLLVSQLAPQLQHVIDLVRPVYGVTVTSVVACGNLPDLRSLAMLLIEEMDFEVETLDSAELLDPDVVGCACARRSRRSNSPPRSHRRARTACPFTRKARRPPRRADPPAAHDSATSLARRAAAESGGGRRVRVLHRLVRAAGVRLVAARSSSPTASTHPATAVVDAGWQRSGLPELRAEATTGALVRAWLRHRHRFRSRAPDAVNEPTIVRQGSRRIPRQTSPASSHCRPSMAS